MLQKAIYYLKHINKIGLLCLLAFLLPHQTTAQNHPVRHYTLRDGLPNMGIRCIYKDTRGLLWIGTDAGLCTFDGKNFRIFQPSEGMTANQVWSIAEDDEGNMWFGSFGDGLFKYDGNHFKRFTSKDGLGDERIRVLCWSRKFHCLVAGSYGCISIIRENTIASFSENREGFDIVGTVTGIADMGDFLYISTYGSPNTIRYFPGKNKFIIVNDKGVRYPESSFSVYLS
jgi:ligand-binding sensor domain-containing protein